MQADLTEFGVELDDATNVDLSDKDEAETFHRDDKPSVFFSFGKPERYAALEQATIQHGFPKLEELTIRSCPNVTQNGVDRWTSSVS